jgi:amino acid adenylation domain-containing protein
MQVEAFLERSAKRVPDKVALVTGDRRWTYRQLESRANALARRFLADGLGRWDRVVIHLENGVDAVVTLFAALKAGGMFVVVNPQVKPDKLAFMLNDCRAAALVTDPVRARALPIGQPALPHLRRVYVAGGSAEHGQPAAMAPLDVEGDVGDIEPPQTRCIDIDLAALIYTSGSTGRPKGVMLTHRNITAATESITTYLESRETDVILSTLPMAFDYGLYQIFLSFSVGGTLVLERSFAYPHPILERLGTERVTGFPIVPTMATLLLQLDLAKYDVSSLRYVTNTAAALSPARIAALRHAWPHVKIYSMYGLTECKRVSYLPPDQIDVRPGSVGRGMPNEEVYIVDDQGRRLGPGQMGELVVRGANVMKGYWERPEETARMLKPGVFPDEKVLHTGDLFTSDEDGYLYFVGRRDDIIKTRGEKVSPREVEEVILELEGVAEVSVTGVPDDVLGEAVRAVIQLTPGARLTEQDVRRHCAARLEDFMRPRVVDFTAALPTTTTGKISRRAVAAGGGAS